MFVMVLLGKLYGAVEDVAGIQRLSIGFNPNDVGVFGMLGMLSILAMDKVWHKNKINVCLFFFFVLVALLSGSKAALLCMILAVLFTYGFNYRIVVSVFFFLIAAYFSSNLGYITSLDRLNSNERTFVTRDEVYANGIKTIQENIFLGHGLDKYNWTNPIYWDSPELALGPHNAYLAAVIMYGIFFAFAFVLFILFFVVKTFKKSFRNNDYFIRFNYFILLIFLVNSFFETLIMGINEFVTVLFWFAVGCVGYNFGFASKKDVEREKLSKTIQV
jgi:O-antigen ligase